MLIFFLYVVLVYDTGSVSVVKSLKLENTEILCSFDNQIIDWVVRLKKVEEICSSDNAGHQEVPPVGGHEGGHLQLREGSIEFHEFSGLSPLGVCWSESVYSP